MTTFLAGLVYDAIERRAFDRGGLLVSDHANRRVVHGFSGECNSGILIGEVSCGGIDSKPSIAQYTLG